jgi:hypothetical protein
MAAELDTTKSFTEVAEGYFRKLDSERMKPALKLRVSALRVSAPHSNELASRQYDKTFSDSEIKKLHLCRELVTLKQIRKDFCTDHKSVTYEHLLGADLYNRYLDYLVAVSFTGDLKDGEVAGEVPKQFLFKMDSDTKREFIISMLETGKYEVHGLRKQTVTKTWEYLLSEEQQYLHLASRYTEPKVTPQQLRRLRKTI